MEVEDEEEETEEEEKEVQESVEEKEKTGRKVEEEDREEVPDEEEEEEEEQGKEVEQEEKVASWEGLRTAMDAGGGAGRVGAQICVGVGVKAGRDDGEATGREGGWEMAVAQA